MKSKTVAETPVSPIGRFFSNPGHTPYPRPSGSFDGDKVESELMVFSFLIPLG